MRHSAPAALALLPTSAPASVEAVAVALLPALGLAIALAIAALQAVILARIVAGPRPWRSSLIANALALVVGLTVLAVQALDYVQVVPPALFQNAWGEVVLFSVCFAATAATESIYLCWRWRKQGPGRVLIGVLIASLASYALLVPLYLWEEKVGLLAYLLDR